MKITILIIILNFLAFSKPTHAEIKANTLKGTYDIVDQSYKTFSPLWGFNLLKSGTLLGYHQVGDPNHQVVKLIRTLFQSPNGQSITISRWEHTPVKYFTPTTIGNLLNRLSTVREEELTDIKKKDFLAEQLADILRVELEPISNNNRKTQFKDKLNTYNEKKLLLEAEANRCSPSSRNIILNQVSGLDTTLQIITKSLNNNPLNDSINKKQQKNAREFANLLLDALSESYGEHASYPKELVPQILLAWMWQRFDTKQDLLKYFQSFQKIVSPEYRSILVAGAPQKEWLEAKYTEADYHAAKEHFLHLSKTHSSDSQSLLQGTIGNPEVYSFTHYAYDLYDNPVPPTLPYGYPEPSNTTETGADCVNTTWRNLLNVLLKNGDSVDTQRLKNAVSQMNEEHHLNLKLEPNILAYYENKYAKLSDHVSDDARKDWYLDVTKGIHQHTILENQIEDLWAILFNEKTPNLNPLEKLRAITTALSRPDFSITFERRSEKSGEHIYFFLNGKPYFKWVDVNGRKHTFVCSLGPDIHPDWRWSIGKELQYTFSQSKEKPSYSDFQLLQWGKSDPKPTEVLEGALARKNPQFRELLALSFPLKRDDVRIQTVSAINRNHWEEMFPFALRIFESTLQKKPLDNSDARVLDTICNEVFELKNKNSLLGRCYDYISQVSPNDRIPSVVAEKQFTIFNELLNLVKNKDLNLQTEVYEKLLQSNDSRVITGLRSAVGDTKYIATLKTMLLRHPWKTKRILDELNSHEAIEAALKGVLDHLPSAGISTLAQESDDLQPLIALASTNNPELLHFLLANRPQSPEHVVEKSALGEYLIHLFNYVDTPEKAERALPAIDMLVSELSLDPKEFLEELTNSRNALFLAILKGSQYPILNHLPQRLLQALLAKKDEKTFKKMLETITDSGKSNLLQVAYEGGGADPSYFVAWSAIYNRAENKHKPEIQEGIIRLFRGNRAFFTEGGESSIWMTAQRGSSDKFFEEILKEIGEQPTLLLDGLVHDFALKPIERTRILLAALKNRPDLVKNARDHGFSLHQIAALVHRQDLIDILKEFGIEP